MFRRILIANRGEIACRIIATARRLGISTVAVYSDADARARHVELADEAWPIGPAPARESYLRIDAIVDVARKSGAEAIHPGYGFLAENADFAEACAARDIVFVGPPPAAIRAMGSKSAAKAMMERSGVPLVPGYHGEAQDLATINAEAERIGYPVLLKASAGGGGKGMRIVHEPRALPAALEGAMAESRSAFGDDHMLVEKYLAAPRHIEIQVFLDSLGNHVSLFERDCSIQRRHQKVIEEAPAPGMSLDRRQAMGRAAIAAARAVGYVGAGTVEFITEGGEFYFMEMNTRLQVEHPVTEMITRQDLVEWQLRVAAGERLPRTQDEIRVHGHAIEVRIYAEDPTRDFLPSIGTLQHLRQPVETPHVRVDTGVRAGDAITPNYDPMIAKLIVWGEDRAEALRHLSAALNDYEVVGVRTNLDLLRAITVHPAFVGGELDTGFILRHPEVLAPSGRDVTPVARAAAALAVLADEQACMAEQATHSGDPCSPWARPDAWRLNGDGYQDLQLHHETGTIDVCAHVLADNRFRLAFADTTVEAVITEDATRMTLRLDGVQHRVSVVRHGEELVVVHAGYNHVLRRIDRLAPPALVHAGDDRLVAPIPARVVRVLVRAGDRVAKGAPLMVLEAMKMEITLSAPTDGIIADVRHAVDDMVEEGAQLVTFAG
jgi:3-methylcrotonyl-CoA carboxylase alpha subunit